MKNLQISRQNLRPLLRISKILKPILKLTKKHNQKRDFNIKNPQTQRKAKAFFSYST